MKKETAYQRRGCSIFCKILHSLLLVLLAEVLLLIFAISTSRVTSQLNENAEDILDKQVENRANYLRQNLIQAQDLNAISGTIDGVTRELVDQGIVDLNTLDTSSEEALPLLQAIVPELVSTLRTKPVNGIFVILSTHDLNDRADDSYLPGLYIRDLDPSALSTDRNADLLAERGPATAFAPLGIATDKGWSPAMPYQPGGKTSFYKESFQIAYASKSKLSAEDYGRWTPATFRLKGDDRDALAYVQPLILDDGTVYGVVGVELLTSYLTTQLPSNELQNTDHGTYLLATTDADLKRDDVINVRTAFLTGEDADKKMPQTLTLYRDGMDWMFWLDGEEQYATLQQLGLYSRNAPFSGEAWLLIGTVAQNDLYRFSHSVRNLLVMAALLAAVVGLVCSVVVARQLAKPVAQLSKELARAKNDHVSVPEFSRTGIRELDQFASAIVQLSRENEEATALERRRIEHERDYDILTGLYNRQAFQRVCENLFAKPETLGHAALLMTDLDNLKTINDTYGHDWGDQYLRQTGRCLAASTPPGTLSARLSGDEFMLLLYGYDSREAVREELEKLRAALQDSASILPSGSELHISISGGVAWYPEDSTDFNTLKKYADFAMYQVKHSRKGEMKEFDIGMYNQEAYAMQTRNEFEQMLRDQAVSYHFQPIFSARNGRAIAYEALMRPEMPTLRSPLTVMKLARELNRLYDIEHITLFKASSAFEKLKERGLIREDSLLFINSIASVSLNDTDWRDYRGRFPELARKLVVEITEEEELDPTQLERKRAMAGASGIFALDDYGSGYSNGSSLLTIAPRYVKVDISIIRSIDTNTDKQQFLTSLVDYARPRNILVLAEGVETTAELRKVLELGVDLLQGYCLARPAAIPPPLSKEAADIIHRMKRC